MPNLFTNILFLTNKTSVVRKRSDGVFSNE